MHLARTEFDGAVLVTLCSWEDITIQLLPEVGCFVFYFFFFVH